MKKIFWPLFFVAVVFVIVFYPAYRTVPPDKSFILLLGIPIFLWMLGIMLQNDRLCSAATRYLVLLASVLCFALGIVLHHYQIFQDKPGFFVVAFGTPLLFVGISEICRLIYVGVRHETPCINVRTGRWIGDRPRDGFYTTFPPDKVISWADVLFGISQMIVPTVIVMVLFICAVVMDW